MMQSRPIPIPRQIQWAGRWLWWIYNVGMLLGLILLSPLWLPIVLASNKRRQTFRQRMGCRHLNWKSDGQDSRPTIWVHALSVGEVTVAQPLIRGLKQRCADHRIVLSASTLSGYQTACRLYQSSRINLAYFPYDLVPSVRVVANRIDPALVILIETDIWPNFLSEMRRRRVPVILANFRLSDPTWHKWRKFKGLAAFLFGSFHGLYVQTQADAQRLRGLGVDGHRMHVTGNLKFDTAALPSPHKIEMHWRQVLNLAAQQPVIVAGSTHEGDESVLLTAFEPVLGTHRLCVLIIVPRDPRRSSSIVTLCRDAGVSCLKLSQMQADPSLNCPRVVVVDAIGVLKELYCLASMAFIGGSLSREGGHNPLEPAGCGKPVIFGPDMRDFQQIAGWLMDEKGARQIGDAKQLASVFVELLNNRQAADKMGRNALAVFKRHQGAISRMLDHLEYV